MAAFRAFHRNVANAGDHALIIRAVAGRGYQNGTLFKRVQIFSVALVVICAIVGIVVSGNQPHGEMKCPNSRTAPVADFQKPTRAT